jgi:hypothetical protein
VRRDRGPAGVAYRGVHYEGGQITGTSYYAAQAVDLAATTRARSVPVVIAAARPTAHGCQRLTDRRGHLDPKRARSPCGRPIWLKTRAEAARGWTFTFAHLPPRGTYIVFVRQASQTLYELSPRLGNAFRPSLP